MRNLLPRLIRLKVAEKEMKEMMNKLAKMSNKTDQQRYKLEAYRRKLEEYKTSIENLETYGWEKMPTGNPVSVDISMPITRKG